MCIDVCPVGALTSGSYRYKTRPWEMKHVSTVCTHCADGCKVTLGVRQSNEGSEIVRADNRDKSGINGDFLCAKGRFGFDFVENPERLTQAPRPQRSGQARARHLGARASLCRGQAQGNSRQQGRRSHRRHRLQPHHQRRELPAAEIRAHRSRHQQHRPRAHRRLRRLRRAPSPATKVKSPACATPRRRRPSCSSAAIPPTNIRCWPGTCAPTYASTAPVSTSPITAPSSSSARPRPYQGLPPDGYRDLTTILDRNESDFAKAVDGRRVAARHLRLRSSAATRLPLSSPGD